MSDYLLSYVVERRSKDKTTQSIVDGWEESWPDIEMDLRWKLRLKLGVPESDEQALVRSLRLRSWASRYPPLCGPGCCGTGCCPQPFTALRARLLHALDPADEDQKGWFGNLVMLLNLSAVYQLCNWSMYVRFLIIDKSDEHQLVSYILANKGYHFIVYGAIQLVQNASAYFNCVLQDSGTEHPCSDGAPGRNEGYSFEFVMEQIRILTVWIAFMMLPYSKGGPSHLVDLERARLEVVPGSKTDKLLSNKDFGLAERSRGGVLRYMFAYDVGCFIFCYGAGMLNLWWKIRNTDCNWTDCSAFIHPADESDGVPTFLDQFELLRDWRYAISDTRTLHD